MKRQLYGPDNPNWKGGKVPNRSKGRVRAWRTRVLERGGHACQRCGSSEELHAHHLRPYEDEPALRWDPENGLTLCARCHRLLHRLERMAPVVRQALEQGWTHAQIAQATGLTRSRVGQLALMR